MAIPRVDYEVTQNFGAFSIRGFDDGDDPLLVISTTVDRVLGFDDEKSGVPNYSRDGDSLPRCPRLIKIDVENYEDEVLGGSTRVLSDCAARGSPPFLFMENLAFQPRHLPSGVMRKYIPSFTSIFGMTTLEKLLNGMTRVDGGQWTIHTLLICFAYQTEK